MNINPDAKKSREGERKDYSFEDDHSRFFNLPTILEKSRWSNLDGLPDRELIRASLNVCENEYLVLLVGYLLFVVGW